MEQRVADLHCQLKKQNPKTLFQYSRSCDFRVAQCIVALGKDGSLAPHVAVTSEYSHKGETTQPIPAFVYDTFFSFSTPIPVSDGVWSTTVKGFSSRILYIHVKHPDTSKEKYWVTTEINGKKDTVFIGVHTKLDLPAVGPPLLRSIVLVGIDKQSGNYVLEALDVRPFLKQMANLFLVNAF